MTWENVKRVGRRAENRRRHHEDQINNAATPRRRLWAACGWLVSEAWKSGRLEEATDRVLTYVHDIREQEQEDSHDRASNAA